MKEGKRNDVKKLSKQTQNDFFTPGTASSTREEKWKYKKGSLMEKLV